MVIGARKNRLTTTPTDRQVGSLTLAIIMALSLSGCNGPRNWSSQSRLRNWEKLTLYGGREELNGNLTQSENYFRQAVEEASGLEGVHTRLAISSKQLAEVLLEEGKLSEASIYFKKAIKLFDQLKTQIDSGHTDRMLKIDYADCLEGLAEAASRLGNLTEANDFYQQALQVYDTSQEPNEVEQASRKALCLAHQAVNYRCLKNESNAQDAYKLALATADSKRCHMLHADIEKLFNNQPPEKNTPVASSSATSEDATKAKLNEIQDEWDAQRKEASALERAGKDKESERAMLKAWEISRQFDRYDLRRVTIDSTAGMFYMVRSQHRKAMPFIEEELKIKEHIFGANDRSLVLPMNRLANVLRENGDISKAEEVAMLASENAKKQFGESSTEYARLLRTLGQIRSEQHKTDSAIKLLKAAAQIFETREDWNGYVGCCETLGTCYGERKNYQAAKQVLDKAVQIADDNLDYREQLTTLTMDADLHLNLKDYKRANELYQKAEDTLRNAVDGRFHRMCLKMAPTVFTKHAQALFLAGNAQGAAKIKEELDSFLTKNRG